MADIEAGTGEPNSPESSPLGRSPVPPLALPLVAASSVPDPAALGAEGCR